MICSVAGFNNGLAHLRTYDKAGKNKIDLRFVLPPSFVFQDLFCTLRISVSAAKGATSPTPYP
jgi:hypothetical protein